MFHGPATPSTFTTIIMILIGLLSAYSAFYPGTRFGAAFSHGKGPTVPIGSAGRLILFLLAVVMLTDAITSLLH